MPSQPGVSNQAERLQLTLLLAVLDERCEDRLPLILRGISATVMVETIHLLAHELVASFDPAEHPTMREDIYRELARLTSTSGSRADE